MNPRPRTKAVPAAAELVARYAPLGRAVRQRRRRRSLLLAGSAALVMAVGGLGWQAWDPRLPGPSPTLAEQLRQREAALERLAAELAAQGEGIRQEERRLAAREAELRRLDAELGTRLAALEAEEAAVTNARRDLERQQATVARLADRAPEPAPAASFGRELIEREAAALKAQRGELDRQRQVLELQRQELKDLMERYEDLATSAPAASSTPVVAPPPATTSQAEPPAATDPLPVRPEGALEAPEELLLASATPMGDSALGEVRGGLRIGPDLDVSFGITRSGSVNGIELYSNSVTLDGLAALTGSDATANLGSMLIQNGAGNAIGPEVLDALTGSLGTVIQNTLDAQVIQTRTVIDLSVGNVGSVLNSVTGSQAISESLRLQQP